MANKFDTWLNTAPAGSQFVYRTGKYLSKGGYGLEFSELVYSAREAFERGEVELVQKRLSHGGTIHSMGTFAWMAIKKAEVKKPHEWITKEGELAKWVNRPEKIRVG